MKQYLIDEIKRDIIGNSTAYQTPFGLKNLFYADYTASGRGLNCIEDKIRNILKSYANSHTEDDYTGKYMTDLLHQAEAKIKKLVNAGDNAKIISIGSGATGALVKLQQILGIYIPPVTKSRLYEIIARVRPEDTQLLQDIKNHHTVVFISPYEHHSNELLWRESFSETVVVKMDSSGKLDLTDLDKQLSNPQYRNRPKIASLSAGSNITGLKSQTYEIAAICHQNNVPILFDFAALAPYVDLNMNYNAESYFDAIFFSPHKFIGGPGSSGVLIFNDNLYRSDLPPTVAGGGTVDYVGYKFHDFSQDTETREKAGTPAILQTIKTALVMDLKDSIGIGNILEAEENLSKIFFKQMQEEDNFEMIGNIPFKDRIPIISFNIKHHNKILHPKFVTKLLNDLFGIQSRAGCSCAGPYGHYLMGIDNEKSEMYRNLIAKGLSGLKPGWVRINLHYTFSVDDLNFLIAAIKFIAKYGYLFLKKYNFNMKTAEWQHETYNKVEQLFSIEQDFKTQQVDISIIDDIRNGYLESALNQVKVLSTEKTTFKKDTAEIEALKFFDYVK
ncbi:MAG: aminotransferase class V-fold PLP-dependent enzyme [Deltaproteobacteria bacterium]|jgi:selenocysteine lyase/cysteine desulfurase|nr:aminotransferase class V-fold PLP-dependent enzyme [Deltaproteobacteria bacterium]MBT4526545.1 aminotransferase class V-fold PLP-dependent enzyme [Deltaproteobacteria bacterium]